MAIELDRLLFKRLVWFYFASLVLLIGVAIYEALDPELMRFDFAFWSAANNHLGIAEPSDAWMIIALLAALVHVTGAIALLWFKRWALQIFIWPILIFVLLDTIFFPSVYYVSTSAALAEFAVATLFGFITLLLISKDHGALWFSKHNERLTR